MKRVFAVLLAAAMGLCAQAPQAQESPRTVIVMDGSGSMWGQIDGRPKLEIARETVGKVLAQIPAEQEIGLLAYGHRRKGDCGDIELVVEPAAGTGGLITDKVNGMRFLGKTPLSQAVLVAAESLRYGEEAATVVLVTDGIETCQADPCALGMELEANGLDFTTHVIGFGLSQEEGAQVACLAENTGGRYFEAGNADALIDALSQTVLSDGPAAKQAPVPTPKASLDGPEAAAITTEINVDWTGPDAVEDYLEIVPATETAATSGSRNYAYTKDGSPAKLIVPADQGDYLIRYIWQGPNGREVIATAPLTVKDSEFAISLPPGPIQAGSVIAVDWKGPNGPLDYLAIRTEASTEAADITYAYTGDTNPLEMVTPNEPGTYSVLYIVEGTGERRIGVSVPLSVVEGTIDLRAPAAVRPDTGFSVAWAGPGSSQDYIDIVPAGYTETYGELKYAYIGGEGPGPRELSAPSDAGAYWIRYVSEGAGGRKVLHQIELSVDPDAPDAPTSLLVAATFDVPADFAGTPVQWSAVPLEGQAVSMDAWAMNEFETGPVSGDFEPGVYSVRGDATDVVFTGAVTISADGDNRFTILPDETLSPTTTPDMADGHGPDDGADGTPWADYAYSCLGDQNCPHTDAASGLSFTLPSGWVATSPDMTPAGTGAQAAGEQLEQPYVEFYEAGGNMNALYLNPRQWIADNGPCQTTGAGELCLFRNDAAPNDPAAFMAMGALQASLIHAAPVAAVPLSADEVESLLDRLAPNRIPAN
ncbi:VWA domain-containing protein [Devosia neptuniae]|jgi:Ca-activated chloride channel family protein|uniref:vWA domain-containing protein n=1 Tax=Devosia TaxID=46913 RepID=UPI0022AEDF65|nr:VWA domain-containing protein [Devosia neptuniae]MCZ4346342.1 VWA domain-containing protein [Devosia neptuniae]|tara:strand:- start:4681 stop:6963 length:2283 start_codon:yes stop_codon:yes gene_type:complete